MERGRPTTYTDEMLALARDYIDNFEEITDELVPTVVGLCRHIKRSKSTVYSWAKDEDKKEFLDILGEIEESQEIKLVFGGLSNAMNPAITKMMMTKHGYSDKIDLDHLSSDKSMSPKGFNDFYDED